MMNGQASIQALREVQRLRRAVIEFLEPRQQEPPSLEGVLVYSGAGVEFVREVCLETGLRYSRMRVEANRRRGPGWTDAEDEQAASLADGRRTLTEIGALLSPSRTHGAVSFHFRKLEKDGKFSFDRLTVPSVGPEAVWRLREPAKSYQEMTDQERAADREDDREVQAGVARCLGLDCEERLAAEEEEREARPTGLAVAANRPGGGRGDSGRPGGSHCGPRPMVHR